MLAFYAAWNVDFLYNTCIAKILHFFWRKGISGRIWQILPHQTDKSRMTEILKFRELEFLGFL